MGLVWEEPTGCRKSQRCDLGAPGASGSWKGAGAGGQGDGPVGLGGTAVQEEIGEVSVGCPGREAGIRAVRETQAPGKTENHPSRGAGRETWKISPYSRTRKSRGTHRGKALSPPSEDV